MKHHQKRIFFITQSQNCNANALLSAPTKQLLSLLLHSIIFFSALMSFARSSKMVTLLGNLDLDSGAKQSCFTKR